MQNDNNLNNSKNNNDGIEYAKMSMEIMIMKKKIINVII